MYSLIYLFIGTVWSTTSNLVSTSLPSCFSEHYIDYKRMWRQTAINKGLHIHHCPECHCPERTNLANVCSDVITSARMRTQSNYICVFGIFFLHTPPSTYNNQRCIFSHPSLTPHDLIVTHTRTPAVLLTPNLWSRSVLCPQLWLSTVLSRWRPPVVNSRKSTYVYGFNGHARPIW